MHILLTGGGCTEVKIGRGIFESKIGVVGEKSRLKGLKSVKEQNNLTKKMYFCVFFCIFGVGGF